MSFYREPERRHVQGWWLVILTMYAFSAMTVGWLSGGMHQKNLVCETY
jgi:hypothetical protein